MENESLFYCSLIGLFFLFITYKKVGIQNKTIILPSTCFFFIWTITSLGGVLFSNRIIGNNTEYYYNAKYLNDIGYFQLKIFFIAILAFVIARLRTRGKDVCISPEYLKNLLPFVRNITHLFLYAFFAFGMLRLIIVLLATGFNYSVIRQTYIDEHSSFSFWDMNLIRICSYLMALSIIDICLLGMESALYGLSIKKIVKAFILFVPFHLSFGGRLFILSFFLPFFFSYLTIYTSDAIDENFKEKDRVKLKYLIILPFFMLIFFQMLKQGIAISSNAFVEYVSELFYSSSIYIHLNELWEALPMDFPLGYGENILGFKTELYSQIKDSWMVNYNSAIVCVPSFIPHLYFDFGEKGTLLFCFFLFYIMESRSINALNSFNLKNFMISIAICNAAFNTACSSGYDVFRSFVVSYIAIIIITRQVKGIEIQQNDII